MVIEELREILASVDDRGVNAGPLKRLIEIQIAAELAKNSQSAAQSEFDALAEPSEQSEF